MGVGTPGVSAAPCLNCGTPLLGEYCTACGQRDLPVDPTIRDFAAEAWDAFVSIDGKVLASLRLLLFRPGALTREYLAGRRASFLPPLRLYLVCSVVYFLVSAALPEAPATRYHVPTATREREARDSVARATTMDSSRRDALASIGKAAPAGPLDSATLALADSVRLQRKLAREVGDNAGWFRRTVYARFIRNGDRIMRDKKNFSRDIKDQVPRIMFVLMPAFAALLALAYRSRRRRYPTHLIVSVHIHAFGFAALTLGALVAALPQSAWRSAGIWAVALWMLAYVPLALRSVYGGRLWLASLRAFVLAGTYAILGAIAFGLGALVLVALY